MREDLLIKLYKIINCYPYIDGDNLYDSRGIDTADLIFECNDIQVWYCQDYNYIDIVGLSDLEFECLKMLINEFGGCEK